MRSILRFGSEALVVLAALGALSGCAKRGGSVDARTPPPGVKAGEKLVLWAPAGVPCPIQSASSAADARAGRAVSLAGHASVQSPLEVTVKGVEHGGNNVILQVAQPTGAESWLLLPRGAPALCVHRDTAALTAATALLRKQLAFAPWKSSCRELHASGRAPQALLVDSDAGVRLEATALKLGPKSADELAKGQSGTTLWLTFGDGLLDVRADSVAGCFADPDSPDAAPPTSIEQRLAPGRCETDAADPRHVSCQTTVATWEGSQSPQALALRRVWRTLGPLHFYDGHLVDGTRFAKTIVRVSLDAPSSDEVRTLHAGLDNTVQKALQSASGGSVRIARADETKPSYQVRVALENVRIGELAQSETTGTSEYKERDEVRPNPKKEPARQRAERARERVTEESDRYDQAKQDAQNRKQQLYEECKRQANNINQEGWRTAASSGCDIGNIAIDVTPSRSALDAAESERNEAESEYNNEPETITVPIMRTHTYKKKLYSRAVSAAVRLELVPDGQPAKTQQIPVSFAWSDFEVQAEPRYNVPGHTPNRGPIDDGRQLLGSLGARIAGVVALKVKQAVFAAALEDARRAFMAAGNSTSQPGFENVDAMAFETAKTRIAGSPLRSRGNVTSGASFSLPTSGVALGSGQCLLAVAVAPPGSEHVRLTLKTADGSHADLRGRPFATVEVCPEPGTTKLPEIVVASPDASEFRWGLYPTRTTLASAAPAATAVTQPVSAPIAPPAEQRSGL